MVSDLEINQAAQLLPIDQIASKLGIPLESMEYYGKYKAKISLDYCKLANDRPAGKIVLVTAMNPTQAGEGKTTTSIGLADALNRLGKQTAVVIRQPSLGPVFGVKGGATGGGHAQVAPMENIDLRFTGDFDAIAAAHNLIAAMADNASFQKTIDLEAKRITWRRVMDMNERALRNIIVGLGKPADGVIHESGFDITAASEIMAILCLANDLADLKEKMGKILVGYSSTGDPVYCKDLKAAGAATALLKDAIKPNLVQTMENNPAFIHGGPFANIAQGYNSILSTQLALHTNEIVVTEAGFGSDLGAEKFFNLVCPYGEFTPSMMVVVATIRAAKIHGGVNFENSKEENLEALQLGLENLGRHIDNAAKFGVDVIVSLNHYTTDTDAEIQIVRDYCQTKGVDLALCNVWESGSAGGTELGQMVLDHLAAEKTTYHPLYDWQLPVEDKIRIVAQQIYGARDVEFAPEAKEDLETINKLNYSGLPLCVAKTQYSLSDNPKLLNAPQDYMLKVRRIIIASGAGFLIPVTGDILRMPGLPKVPSAENIDIDANGLITGLF